MDHDTLASMVARMRYLQIEAATYKNSRTIQQCKRAEDEVDKYLQKITPAPQGVQKRLFDN